MARRVLLCLPSGTALIDPDPDETARRDVELATEWGGSAAGIIGWSEGGWTAVDLAAQHGDLVDRLVLVSTPVPGEGAAAPSAVTAKRSSCTGLVTEAMHRHGGGRTPLAAGSRCFRVKGVTSSGASGRARSRTSLPGASGSSVPPWSSPSRSSRSTRSSATAS